VGTMSSGMGLGEDVEPVRMNGQERKERQNEHTNGSRTKEGLWIP
jgi:hypothetical protein